MKAGERVLRQLNDIERTTIERALWAMFEAKGPSSWAAKAMLEEGMHLKLWWMDGESL